MKRQRSSDATVVKVEQDVVVVEARPRVKRRDSRDFVIEEVDRGAEESSKGGSENGRVHCKDGEESVPIESEGRKALVGTKRTNAKREEDEKAAAMEAAAAAASSEREEGELEPEDDTTNGEKEGENTVVAESEPMKEDLPVSVEVDKNSEPGLEATQFDLHLRVEQDKKHKEVEVEGNSSQGRGFERNPSPDNFFTKLGREREREREETGKEEETRQTEKKQRVEDGAHLSLALLDTSLSLSSGDIHSRPQKQRRSHSHPSQQAPSHSRAFTDSLSLSHSLPFHHNPSCSLTQTSMDKTELSSGSQQLSYGSWQKPQGNEGSLRKSKPLYQKALLSNPQILQGSLGRAHNVENSQVPVPFRSSSQSDDARRAMRRKHRHGEPGEVWSSPSRSGDSRENSKGVPEREFTSIGVQDIVSEPIPSMARKLQELPDSFLAGLKENLREMLNSIEKREQFVQLQQTLGARKDLSTDVLLRAHRIQLELLVAVKTGILAFLHSDIPMTHSALVEVFLQQRCRNFVCQNQLPADDCDCKLCAQKAGFCNSCMCVVCSKFDFDANTCRWIGCDFCLHWCHTDCGIRMSYITPGPSIRGAAGTTEMQFNCVACGHTSELYGFVKDVFCTCATEWGRDVLARELDCVRRIFHGSTDTRGKQLCSKAEVILQQLNSQVDTAVAGRSMVKFFDESSSHGATPDQSQAAAPLAVEAATKKQVTPLQTVSNNKQQQTTLEMAKEALATYDSELEQKRQEASELQQERERKKAQIEELESIVRIKQAEAKMFALRADEARREAEGLHRIMIAKADKIEQEYSGKLSKLGIEDAEDRCRKHRETVQVLQQAQMDFHAMNLPLLNELHELLKQLEASKRHSWK